MNTIALTPIEQQFAEDHHGLVYSFLKRKNLSVDDYYDVVVFGYLLAIQRYFVEPKLRNYSFSTIGWRSMERSLSNHYKAQSCQKRKGYTVSLETIVHDSENLQLGECIAAPDSAMMDFETELLLHELASRLSTRDMNVIRMKLDGYGTREIARKHKLTMKGVIDLLTGLHDSVVSVCY